MRLFERLRALARPTSASPEVTVASASGSPAARLPDPARPPEARGSWEQAALTNVDITEMVKRQLGTVTPPWKK